METNPHKHIATVLFLFLLAGCLLLGAGFAAAEPDWTPPEGVSFLDEDDPIAIDLSPEEAFCIGMIPTEAKAYTLSGTNELPVQFSVVDENGNDVAQMADAHSVSTQVLEADQVYYFLLTGEEDETFEIQLQSLQSYLSERSISLDKDDPTAVCLSKNDPVFYSFIPTEAGCYALAASDEAPVELFVLDENGRDRTLLRGDRFLLTQDLDENELYFFIVQTQEEAAFDLTLLEAEPYLSSLAESAAENEPTLTLDFTEGASVLFLRFAPQETGDWLLSVDNSFSTSISVIDLQTSAVRSGSGTAYELPCRMDAGNVYYCMVCCNTEAAFELTKTRVCLEAHTVVIDRAVAPTCTEPGLTEGSHCTVCGTVLTEQQVVSASGHDLVPHEAKAPTCTEIGWDAYDTCSRCDYTTYVEKEAKGHDLVHHDAQAPTCTGIGWDAYDTCSRCDYTTYVEKPASGHDLVPHEAKAPTCTEIGWDAYDTCSRCTYSTYVEKEAKGHNLEHHDAQEPTCTEIGWDAYDTCSRCTYSTYVEKEAKGHDLEHHDAQAPTCTEIGWDAYDTCSRCDYTTYTVKPALDHAIVHHDAKAPTCTTVGWNAYDTCARCDFTTYAEKPALDHTSPNAAGNCDRCGTHLTDVTVEVQKPANACSYCGEVHTGPFGWLIGFIHSILALFGLRK